MKRTHEQLAKKDTSLETEKKKRKVGQTCKIVAEQNIALSKRVNPSFFYTSMLELKQLHNSQKTPENINSMKKIVNDLNTSNGKLLHFILQYDEKHALVNEWKTKLLDHFQTNKKNVFVPIDRDTLHEKCNETLCNIYTLLTKTGVTFSAKQLEKMCMFCPLEQMDILLNRLGNINSLVHCMNLSKSDWYNRFLERIEKTVCEKISMLDETKVDLMWENLHWYNLQQNTIYLNCYDPVIKNCIEHENIWNIMKHWRGKNPVISFLHGNITYTSMSTHINKVNSFSI